jgi:hypothetical protein
MAVVSDSLSLTMHIYNATTRNTQSFSSSLITFEKADDSNFAIGSSLSGLNKFIGFIREFRVWATARQLSDIAL